MFYGTTGSADLTVQIQQQVQQAQQQLPQIISSGPTPGPQQQAVQQQAVQQQAVQQQAVQQQAVQQPQQQLVVHTGSGHPAPPPAYTGQQTVIAEGYAPVGPGGMGGFGGQPMGPMAPTPMPVPMPGAPMQQGVQDGDVTGPLAVALMIGAEILVGTVRQSLEKALADYVQS